MLDTLCCVNNKYAGLFEDDDPVPAVRAARRRQAQIAAYTRWAFEPDRSAATAPARRASDLRFERMVDPDGVLSPEERAVRAEAARRAHFLRMAHRSAEVRRARRAGERATKAQPAQGAA